jgi:hypothetical protein
MVTKPIKLWGRTEGFQCAAAASRSLGTSTARQLSWCCRVSREYQDAHIVYTREEHADIYIVLYSV